MDALNETLDEVTTNYCGKEGHASALSEIGIITDLEQYFHFLLIIFYFLKPHHLQ